MEDLQIDKKQDFDSTKIKKIVYSINLLLQTGYYITSSKDGLK